MATPRSNDLIVKMLDETNTQIKNCRLVRLLRELKKETKIDDFHHKINSVIHALYYDVILTASVPTHEDSYLDLFPNIPIEEVVDQVGNYLVEALLATNRDLRVTSETIRLLMGNTTHRASTDFRRKLAALSANLEYAYEYKQFNLAYKFHSGDYPQDLGITVRYAKSSESLSSQRSPNAVYDLFYHYQLHKRLLFIDSVRRPLYLAAAFLLLTKENTDHLFYNLTEAQFADRLEKARKFIATYAATDSHEYQRLAQWYQQLINATMTTPQYLELFILEKAEALSDNTLKINIRKGMKESLELKDTDMEFWLSMVRHKKTQAITTLNSAPAVVTPVIPAETKRNVSVAVSAAAATTNITTDSVFSQPNRNAVPLRAEVKSSPHTSVYPSLSHIIPAVNSASGSHRSASIIAAESEGPSAPPEEFFEDKAEIDSYYPQITSIQSGKADENLMDGAVNPRWKKWAKEVNLSVYRAAFFQSVVSGNTPDFRSTPVPTTSGPGSVMERQKTFVKKSAQNYDATPTRRVIVGLL